MSNKGVTDLIEYPTEDEKQQLQKRVGLYADVADTFGTSHGRRVLLHLLKQCYVYDTIFTGNARTHYLAGINDFGKDLLDLIAISDPETYMWFHRQRPKELQDEVLAKELEARRMLEPEH